MHTNDVKWWLQHCLFKSRNNFYKGDTDECRWFSELASNCRARTKDDDLHFILNLLIFLSLWNFHWSPSFTFSPLIFCFALKTAVDCFKSGLWSLFPFQSSASSLMFYCVLFTNSSGRSCSCDFSDKIVSDLIKHSTRAHFHRIFVLALLLLLLLLSLTFYLSIEMQSRCIVGAWMEAYLNIYCMNRMCFTQLEFKWTNRMHWTFSVRENEREECVCAFRINGTKSVDCRLECEIFNHSIFGRFNFTRNKSWSIFKFVCKYYAFIHAL